MGTRLYQLLGHIAEAFHVIRLGHVRACGFHLTLTPGTVGTFSQQIMY